MDNNFGNVIGSAVGSVAVGPGLIFFLVAYIIGSIPFGLLLTKVFVKKDIRTIGSGNIGTTNVLRTGNKLLALATLIFDLSKGLSVVYLISLMTYATSPANEKFLDTFLLVTNPLIFGLFAVLGHCYPVWLKFKGGKGFATALGVFLAAVPYAGLAACGAWLVTAFAFKYSSLAALVAVAVAPVVTFFVYGATPAGICALITLLVFWRHRENIKRLMKGEESKISFKKKEERGGSVSE